MPARNLVILILAAIVSMVCYHTASRNHYGGLIASAIGEINETFVRPVDDRSLFEGAMDGMIRELDPYSDYISPEELSEFQEDLDQKFGGIGIVVEFDPDADRITVMSPLPDTPAIAAGIRAGDQILAIDDKNVEGFQIREAVDLMRGDPGTEIRLSILHLGEDEPEEITLNRAIIPVASVLGDKRLENGTWDYTLRGHPNIGMIRLSGFGEKTASELRSTLTWTEPLVDGVILDLRRNGGGLLKAAVEVCDLFIDKGTIVSIRGRDPSDWRDYSATSKNTVFKKPLVVLIDGYSASASEITAGCLQDHDRAIVVGERSWGKGTVQNVMMFEGGQSALKLTVATYWRPSGKNIHRHVDAKEEDAWEVTPNEGYLVETTDEVAVKIMRLRVKRDKVIEEELVAAEPDDTDTPLEEALTGDDEKAADEEKPKKRDDSDLIGFEDPQRARAIEAILELIETAKSSNAE